MDVSIAVSLIQGQMGAVVERAVNGAVETVLAEMLKVVGVKFEELKSQVALMKRDMAVLQREKAQKEKENDNIRAKLRYTELKLKYYRQGVEEELQQRVSASALIHGISPGQRVGSGVSPAEASSSCSTQTRTAEVSLSRSNPECTSSQSTSKHDIRTCVRPEPADLLLPVSLSEPSESLDSSSVLFCSTDQDTAVNKGEELDNDSEWKVTLQPFTDGVDAAVAAPTLRVLSVESQQRSDTSSLTPDDSTQADSSTLPPSIPQVKQEVQPQQEEEEEEEVICIKEEPEEEQEVMATLLLDCDVQDGPVSESEAVKTVTEWSGPQASGRNHSAACSSSGPSSCLMSQPAAPLPSVVVSAPAVPPRQAMRPWTKELSLYEEYKLRRNEVRRRSINRRRELEKMLPQPLLADLLRERREKTRLRVARWRAKRKLQACLNEGQTQDAGVAGISQNRFPTTNQHQQLRAPCASASTSQQRQSLTLHQFTSLLCNTRPLINPSSSSSSRPLRGPSTASHANQQAVTSSTSYPQVNLSQQSISLTDSDILDVDV
ncbi:uncharacterized protein LOC115411921 isoform X2 [Sphaeramia orbicularis]|uniref:uncharacterized protein LOC115411921 isoform X2 n=1 Tax=Sphaeramia orbicularis TaxID=375764 RepID=UPI00117FFC88|nr:uncharacterized protein LOC115411921 isoform X2 [Sphaeramia orbicularis]